MVCCKNRKTNTCSTGSVFTDKHTKVAFATLLTRDDSYLPGVIALGLSIRANVPKDDWPNVSLVLMVTDEITKSATECANSIYDEVVTIPHLQTSASLIAHKKPEVREVYKLLFCKLSFFTLIQYKKVVYLDADTLVLKPDIVNLFAMPTPAAVYFGCSEPWKNKQEYFDEVCTNFQPGTIPSSAMLRKPCKRRNVKFETALVVITPDVRQYEAVVRFVRSISKPIGSDGEVFNKLYAHKTHILNGQFLGRWADAKEVVVMDSYGNEGKPWEEQTKPFSDVLLWRDFYKHMFPTLSRECKKNRILKKTFEFVNK